MLYNAQCASKTGNKQGQDTSIIPGQILATPLLLILGIQTAVSRCYNEVYRTGKYSKMAYIKYCKNSYIHIQKPSLTF